MYTYVYYAYCKIHIQIYNTTLCNHKLFLICALGKLKVLHEFKN